MHSVFSAFLTILFILVSIAFLSFLLFLAFSTFTTSALFIILSFFCLFDSHNSLNWRLNFRSRHSFHRNGWVRERQNLSKNFGFTSLFWDKETESWSFWNPLDFPFLEWVKLISAYGNPFPSPAWQPYQYGHAGSSTWHVAHHPDVPLQLCRHGENEPERLSQLLLRS